MKAVLRRKKHYETYGNPDYNEDEPSSAGNPVLLRSDTDVSATCLVGLTIDGVEVDVLGGSPIAFEAGPGATTITVTLICNEIEFEDV